MAEDRERRSKRAHPKYDDCVDEDDDYEDEDDDYEETEEEKQALLRDIYKVFDEKIREFGGQVALPVESTFEFGSTSSAAAFSCDEAAGKVVTKGKQSTRPMKKKMKKMQERSRPAIVSNDITKRLKQFITDDLNGREAKMVIQKTLFASDLRKNQNRLNMPMNQVETDDFLSKDEKTELMGKKEMEVKMWGPTLQKHGKPLVLTVWKLTNTHNYVLKTNWHSFVMENKEHLKEKTMIQVWSFRRKKDQLCFAIACVEGPADGQNEAVNI